MNELKNIYKSKNHLVLDVVDNQSPFTKNLKKYFSNAIFSLDKKVTGEFALLILGVKTDIL